MSVLWDCIHKGGIIRIYQECDGGIERSMPRITVWHHEACQVVIIGYPSGRFFFLSYPHTNNALSSCSPSNFALLFHKGSQKILITLRRDMTLRRHFTISMTSLDFRQSHVPFVFFFPMEERAAIRFYPLVGTLVGVRIRSNR